jgi:5S rRNA maturation endonuclease (ribonuclease M5)
LRERYLGVDIDLISEVKHSEEESFSFSGMKYELVELKEKEVTHPALKRYLKQRGITKIPKWLIEVHYWLKDKETGEIRKYFSLGVQTVTGSWILRNPMIKMNLRISDEQEHSFAYLQNGNKRLVIVEGLFDALSVHQIARRGDFDLLIMSGTGNAKKLLRSGVCERYGEVIVATDRDEAGEKFFNELFDYFVEREKVITLKRITFNAKDLNEAVIVGERLKSIDYTKKLKKRIKPPELDDRQHFDFGPGM